ncbi:MAG: hypothetical protein BWY43_00801 [candidate division WS2 bacterium ADurb.Bin280]|uniref:Uncharacterized protein n=1 Tax=candidate division WS2 bacterium ADurb.Bin280 TaxID=1852829 RepID=A0A1V5SC34_9BACT|nr:MAG: hypothetical protein BWY43_00801 [candidate division WS2 bacterium ADurb.Bin280]
MKKVDVLIYIEHVAREILVATVTKYYLEREGFSVLIESLPLKKHNVACKNPRLILFPYFYTIDNIVLRRIAERFPDSVYLNFNYEQFFSRLLSKYKAPKGDYVLNKVYHLSWSKDFSRFLSDNGVKRDHIFEVGSLPLTLMRTPYSNIFKTRNELAKEYNLDSEKKWIFFPENYAWAFLTIGEIMARVRLGYSPYFAIYNKLFYVKSYRRVLLWLKSLNPDEFEIILRPRPAISSDEHAVFIKKTLKHLPQSLHIIREEDMRAWILSNDVIISSISTGLLDAISVSKPSYRLEPFKTASHLRVEAMATIPKLTDERKFISAMHNPRVQTLQREMASILAPSGDPIVKSIIVIKNLLKKGKPISFQARSSSKRVHESSDKEIKKRFSSDYFDQRYIDDLTRKWRKILN